MWTTRVHRRGRAPRRHRVRGVARARAIPAFEWQPPPDEWDAIALNYTSGTTGNPKGVVYHHRGAYLNAISNILDWTCRSTRCTCGRCRCSTATAGASRGPWRRAPAPTCACARSRRSAIFELIREHGVTHYCGAPIVHSMLVNAPDGDEATGIDARGARPWSPARAPPAVDDRRHGADGLRHHARLRPDRGLRSGGGVREAATSGTTLRHRRARAAATAARACATTCRRA